MWFSCQSPGKYNHCVNSHIPRQGLLSHSLSQREQQKTILALDVCAGAEFRSSAKAICVPNSFKILDLEKELSVQGAYCTKHENCIWMCNSHLEVKGECACL